MGFFGMLGFSVSAAARPFGAMRLLTHEKAASERHHFSSSSAVGTTSACALEKPKTTQKGLKRALVLGKTKKH